MTDNRWEDTIALIKKNFTVLGEDSGVDDEMDNATYQAIEFEAPMGTFRVVRTKHPRVTDKKTQYARAGGETRVDYTYDPSDLVDTVEVLQWDEMGQDWGPATAEGLVDALK